MAKDVECVCLLLSHHADPAIETVFGKTPLITAAENDCWDICRLLYDAQATPSLGALGRETALFCSPSCDHQTWLLQCSRKVRDLAHLCRSVIRQQLKRQCKNVTQGSKLLPLPSVLKNYISFVVTGEREDLWKFFWGLSCRGVEGFTLLLNRVHAEQALTPDPEYRALSRTTNHNTKVKYTRAKILQTAQGTDQCARVIIDTINSANPLSWEDSVELRKLEILAQIPSSTTLRIQKILCCLVFVPPSFFMQSQCMNLLYLHAAIPVGFFEVRVIISRCIFMSEVLFGLCFRCWC